MNSTDIAFPNLGIYLHDVPKTFSVFGFSIALYGCIIGTGILLGVLLAAYDRRDRGLSDDPIWDVAAWAVVISIISARAYYVIFAWDYYKDNLINVFNIRQGGLAIYGGVIGAFLTIYVYCRIKKVSFLELFDSIALGFPLGQAMGRWGNFFNREAFGGWSEGPFSMRLPLAAVRDSDISDGIRAHITAGMDYIQVHPTFLYESAWNFCLLIFLFIYRRHKKFSGEIFFLYLFFYGLGRIFIEGLRTDQLIAPVINIPISQIVAGLCMIASAVFIIYKKKSLKNTEGSKE
ncbi:MAG: prolipoprotein diacylglyceryl transferase [Lachnospiraceae bacterium]|nr:prolipoprotein diacylglyceryl transferase [Lachnospiraceae bacterium]